MSMDKRPIDPAVLDRLAKEENVWLCTVRPDGSPHVAPVWFVFDQGSWWIGTDSSSVRVRNIETSPRVSLALEDGRAPVVAEGEARLHRDGFPPELAAAFAAKYDWDVTAPYKPGAERLLVEVQVRRWLLSGTAQ